MKKKLLISIPRVGLGDIFYHCLGLSILSKHLGLKAYLFCKIEQNWLPEYFDIYPINDKKIIIYKMLYNRCIYYSLINDMFDYLLCKTFLNENLNKNFYNQELLFITFRGRINKFFNFNIGFIKDKNIFSRLKISLSSYFDNNIEKYIYNLLVKDIKAESQFNNYICIFPDARLKNRSIELNIQALQFFLKKNDLCAYIFTCNNNISTNFKNIKIVDYNNFDFKTLISISNLSIHNYVADSFPSHFLGFLKPKCSVFYNFNLMPNSNFEVWCIPKDNQNYAISNSYIFTSDNKKWRKLNENINNYMIKPNFIKDFD